MSVAERIWFICLVVCLSASVWAYGLRALLIALPVAYCMGKVAP